MRSLLDINVLIALLDPDHASHDPALDWFTQHARDGWASCPMTQNGCIRIMSHPGYPNPLPVRAVIEHLASACEQDVHEFWADDISLLNPHVVTASHIHGPRQLTDVYLLALAVQQGGRLVTFDSGIPISAADNATMNALLVL